MQQLFVVGARFRCDAAQESSTKVPDLQRRIPAFWQILVEEYKVWRLEIGVCFGKASISETLGSDCPMWQSIDSARIIKFNDEAS